MLAVLDVRLKELLPFFSGDDEDEEEGAGDAEATAAAFLDDENRCFFWGEGEEVRD